MSSEAGERAPFPPVKRDPEALVLRGRPRPVIRFRRGLVVGISAALCATLGGLAWFALEPPSFRLAMDKERPELSGKPRAEALAAAPATYADVPRLGPPLPGDLGRAILDRKRKLGDAGLDADGAGEGGTAETERGRAAAELRSARGSPVLVRLERDSEGAGAGSFPAASPQAAETPSLSAARPLGAGLDRQQAGPSGTTLNAGTVIPASLITGLNSDLPGIVLAQVTEPVRDSAIGRTVLIPQGARLIGSYDDRIAFGQERALVAWTRIVFPDGSSVELDKVPATDRAGFAGLHDRSNSHGWRLLKGVILSTLLGVGSELSLANEESELVRAVRESTEQAGESAGSRIVSKDLDAKPTLTIRPGWPVRAILLKDIVLEPWSE